MAKREANIVVRLIDEASGKLKSIGGAANKVTKAFVAMGAAVVAGAAFFGVRFLAGAIRQAGDFGEAMSRVEAVTQASGEELEKLERKARDAGASTRFTAVEAAGGLEELARAGQSANESIESLGPVLDLAAANSQSVGESAIQVSTALNSFGLAADRAGRVADVYTRAAQRSATTTGQLAEAMTTVAPVANQAGLTIEQTAAVLGRFADQGFRGSLGGTAFRNALLQLDDPTSKFREELRALGITSTDFIQVLKELEENTGDTGAAFRALGVRAVAPVRSLDGLSGSLNGLIDELGNAGGAARNAAEIMGDNLPGAFREARSAFLDLQIELAKPLVERITKEVQRFTAVLRDFASSDTVAEFRDLLVDGFNASIAAAKEFIAGIDFADVKKRLSDFVVSARERLAQFQETAAAFKQGFDIVVGSAQVAVGTLRTAFNGLGIVIGTAIGFAIESLGKLVGFLNATSFGTSSFLRNLRTELKFTGDSIRESVDGFVQSAGDGTDQIAAGFDRLGNAGREAGREIREGLDRRQDIQEGLTDPTNKAADAAEGARRSFSDFAAEMEALQKEAAEAGDAIDGATESIQKFERITGDFGNGIETRLVPQIQEIGNAAEEAGERSEDGLGDTAEGLDRASDSATVARRSVETVADSTEKASRGLVSLAGVMNATIGKWRDLSDGAARAADRFLESINRGVNSIGGFLTRLRQFNDGIEKQQVDQQAEADRLIRQYEQIGLTVEDATRAQALLNREVLLLDDSRVQSLAAAIKSVADESQRAREEAADLVESLENDLLRLQGRTDEIDRRRLQSQREQIELQLRSGDLDRETRDNLQQALSLLDQQQTIRRQQAEDTNRAAQSNERAADAAEREADAVERLSRSRPAAAGPTRIELEIKSIGGDPGAPILSQADVQVLATQLTPIIIDRIRSEFRVGL